MGVSLRSAGCPWCHQPVPNADQLQHHQASECPLRVVECVLGCNVADLRANNAKLHYAKICPLRPVNCPRECGNMKLEDPWEPVPDPTVGIEADPLLAHQLSQHLQHLCPLREVVCQARSAEMPASEGYDHISLQCSARSVLCGWGCNAVLTAAQLTVHQKIECSLRIVGCKFGCGIPSMRPNAVSQHETEQCPHRPVWCRWLCGEKLGGNHPDAIGSCVGKCNDQTASSELRVRCELGCLQAQALEGHETLNCPNRPIECPQRCGRQDIVASQLADHILNSCPNRIVKCEACGKAVKIKDIPPHAHNCPERSEPCVCGMLVPVKGATDHQRHHCTSRTVGCPLGCRGVEILASQVEHHTTNECPLRLQQCPLNCAMSVTAQNLQNHQAHECPNRVVKCPLECGIQGLLAKQLDDHQASHFSSWTLQGQQPQSKQTITSHIPRPSTSSANGSSMRLGTVLRLA